MCKSKAEGGERCEYGIRQAKLRNASARLKHALKQLENEDLSPEERIKAVAKRDAILAEQYELYAEEGETSLPEGWENHLTDNIAADLEKVKALVATKDIAGLESFVEERSNTDEFVTALETSDNLYHAAEASKEEFKRLEAEYNANGGSFEDARQAALRTVEINEMRDMVRAELVEYRSVTAQAAFAMSQLREEKERAEGTYLEYTADRLNDLEAIGEYPSGSREWLESRQGGIGGSDVGSIVGVDPAWAGRDYREVLATKVLPISDEQVDEQGNSHEDFTSAPGRGNAWEEEVLHRFAQNNPDLTVGHCKTSWRNSKLPFQYANFDGLLFDKNGNPDGIVEIKTGSNPDKWGDPSEGIDGVPAGYRAQVLWYMQAAGFKRGAVAVVLNDREYREYHFTLNDALRAEQESNLNAAKEFWNVVEEARKDPSSIAPKKRAGGFPVTALRPGNANKAAVFRDAAAYREETVEQVRAKFESSLSSPEDKKDPEKVEAALRRLYTDYNPTNRKKPVVGIDLETNTTSPLRGRIIEMGLTSRAPDGTEVRKIQQLHGLSDAARRGTGTGAVHVHHINPSDLLGKPRFESERNQKRVLSALKRSGVVLAHNARYEDSWLRIHLKGYAEARDKGEIRMLDTMNLTRNLIPDAEDNTLRTFVERNGGQYVDAHRAFHDAKMMTDAFYNFQKDLFKNK